MIFPLRFNIRLKMIFSFFLLLFLIIAGFTISSYLRTSAGIQKEIVKHGVDVTRIFTQMASTYVFESDYITIYDNADALVKNSDIRSITLLDNRGKTWVSTDLDAPLFTEPDPFHQDVIQSRKPGHRMIHEGELAILEFVSPIIALNKVPFLVKVEIPLKVIEEELAENRNSIILLSMAMILLAVTLGIFFSSLLTGPIEQLARGTSEISRGNLDFRIDVSTGDEIGELADSFNAMTSALKAELRERRQVEASLRRHRDLLEETVESRTLEIREALEKLTKEIAERKAAEAKKRLLEARLARADRMEAIGTLAGGVAHDLNNILSAIVTYPDLILLKLPGDSPLRPPLKTMQDSGLRASAIVDDLLTLARRGILTTEVENLNTIIEQNLSSPEFEELMFMHGDIHVTTELEEGLMNIPGSKFHLSKTLMNIIANGVESMPGGGTLSITTTNRYLDRPINGYEEVNEGDYVVVRISDSGTGMDSSDMEHIFEPFFTTKSMGKSGSGLGMAVVWGTVKDHNGYIDVCSKPGQGSTFTLYIPATRRQQAKEVPGICLEELRGCGQRILVVDDAPQQREIAATLLTQLDYRVETVQSGKAALTFLEDRAVDLVILDMIMEPGFDGLDTVRAIKEIDPDQKIIIVSGYSETERVRTALELGAGSYVKKPYILEKIASAVRTELGPGAA